MKDIELKYLIAFLLSAHHGYLGYPRFLNCSSRWLVWIIRKVIKIKYEICMAYIEILLLIWFFFIVWLKKVMLDVLIKHYEKNTYTSMALSYSLNLNPECKILSTWSLFVIHSSGHQLKVKEMSTIPSIASIFPTSKIL